jgi:polysaccharide biosynthesis/export protein
MFNRTYVWSGVLIGFLLLSLMGQPQKIFAATWSEVGKSKVKKTHKKTGDHQRKFVLGPEDIVEISVWGNEEFAGDLPVRPDGNVSIPLIGDIKVEGLTPAEVKNHITKKLRKFITDANVTVFVKQINSINISIAGEVNAPGTYKVNRPITLLHLFSISHGFTDRADLKNSFLLRKGEKMDIDFYNLVKKGDLSQNVWVLPNDLIFIKDNFNNRINVIGEVTEPQVITFQEGMTVLDAILIARGLTDVAKPKGTQVYRRSQNRKGQIEKIPVDLDEVISDGDLTKNVSLKPGDIIHVPRSFF